MKLLDRYIIQRLILIVLFAIGVFTLSWLAPEIMFRAIQGISQHQLTVIQGLNYLLYQISLVLTYCIPISTLLGSVFLMRQFSLSSELTAVQTSGVSFIRILAPVAVVGAGMALLFFLTQEVLMPAASASLRHLNQLTHFDDSANVVHPQVTFIEKSPQGALEKFMVISPQGPHPAQNRFIFLFYQGSGEGIRISQMTTATHGSWDAGMNLWHLQDGVDYSLNADGIYRRIAVFDRRDVHTSPVAHALLSFPTGNPAEFKVKQLDRYVRLLIMGGQTEDARFYQVRLFQRYFLPLIPILFAVFGAAIGVERSRAKRNMGLIYAAGLLLLYNIVVPATTTMGSIGLLSPALAALLPILIALLGGFSILRIRKFEG